MSSQRIPLAVLADPVRIAWRWLREQPVGDPGAEPTSDAGEAHDDPAGDGAPCARCRDIAPLIVLREVVSENFTGWEGLDAAGAGVCVSCAWGYRDSRLRTRPVIVEAVGARWASPQALLQVLSRPLPPDVTVTVPVSGKKHLLPDAQWGAVSCDAGVLVWHDGPAALVATVAALRAAGVRENEFAGPVPPYRLVMERLSSTEETLDLLREWESLRPWQAGPHLPVVLRITRAARPDATVAEDATGHRAAAGGERPAAEDGGGDDG